MSNALRGKDRKNPTEPPRFELRRFGRRGLFGLALGGLITASFGARTASVAEVAVPIMNLNAGLLSAMQAGRAVPFPQRYEMLAPIVDHAFDLPRILRAAVGVSWSALSAQDQAELLEAFRRFTVASYVARFDKFGGMRFEVLPELRAVGDYQVVATRIVPNWGAPTRIDYVMRPPDNAQGMAWKVVDVLLGGSISQVVVERSEFRSLLGDDGATNLIAMLRRKVGDLSGGTLAN